MKRDQLARLLVTVIQGLFIIGAAALAVAMLRG
jgi:hypothetical protein